jgi:hypothetical protein
MIASSKLEKPQKTHKEESASAVHIGLPERLCCTHYVYRRTYWYEFHSLIRVNLSESDATGTEHHPEVMSDRCVLKA